MVEIDMVQLLINEGGDISEAGHGQYEPPVRGEGEPGNHGSQPLRRALARLDQQAALLEPVDPQGGPQPPADPPGQLAP